ncbi:MAG: hypothetical protein ABH868_04325 [bacterium]
MTGQIRNRKNEKRELRKFAITISVVLSLWGAVFFWRDKGYYGYFFAFSSLFLFSGLVLPVLSRPVYKIWMIIAEAINWLITRLILAFLLYFIFTPLGFIAKIFGKNFLDLGFKTGSSTYWIVKDKTESEKKCYEKQF